MTLRSCALAVAVALSLAGCSDGPLPVTATRVLEVAGLRAVVNAVALSPDGSLVVVVGGTTIHLVDLERGELVRTLPNAHQGDRIDAVAFSGDGRVLATTSDGGGLKLWNWPALTLRGSVSMASSLEAMAPVSLALNRDGTRAAANGILGQVHVMNVVKEREERRSEERR